MGGPEARWQPLNVAYVDERRELFVFSPERLVLAARAAGDLKGRTDTTFHGLRYRAATATVNRIPTLLLFDPATGLLAAAHFSAAQPNDFGLAPWGTMPVELWFARWQRHRGGVAYPTQVDVMRAGRPYKRMTVLSAAFDVAAMPDSFAVADSLRAEFRLTQNRPMHDLPLDSARIIEGTFATFGPFGPPVGAVKVGGVWVLLEAGQAPLNAQRTVDWLERADAQSGVLGALVTVPYAGSGGVAWLTREGRPLWTAPGARPFVDAMLKGHAVTDRPRSASLTTITNPTWLKVGTDSLRLEPIDLPSGRGAMLVYAPTLKWAYAGLLASPLDMDAVAARIRERGWTVERIGSRRGIAAPMPARTASGN
jgi:hypothetical protein